LFSAANEFSFTDSLPSVCQIEYLDWP
jgi:hypothetical protein